ncbi:hypothetical protein SGGMMB4_01180 [Sodalis glossinidius str. 'morsitans']|uniref:HTH-type transcriptional repressor NicS C-terminal domain-containing protein n=1 Tax=Sodalis glossinidius (strain morsitans) TaxID=343509 RepID=A0A193QGB6_SODGM|nr:hypothetical protein SGGMMB4_01180 [Sodalis glossinidius str. 'morsitans']
MKPGIPVSKKALCQPKLTANQGTRAVASTGVDPGHLYITMASVGYYYLNNRYTLEVIYGQNFVSADALEARFAFNVDTTLRLLKP